MRGTALLPCRWTVFPIPIDAVDPFSRDTRDSHTFERGEQGVHAASLKEVAETQQAGVGNTGPPQKNRSRRDRQGTTRGAQEAEA
jgi:hypothetical protein